MLKTAKSIRVNSEELINQIALVKNEVNGEKMLINNCQIEDYWGKICWTKQLNYSKRSLKLKDQKWNERLKKEEQITIRRDSRQ